MNARDFTVWLKGYLEGAETLTQRGLERIKKELDEISSDPIVVSQPNTTPYPILPDRPWWEIQQTKFTNAAGMPKITPDVRLGVGTCGELYHDTDPTGP